MIQTGLHALLVLLAFALPFEMIHPVLVLPGVRFTNLELLAYAAIVVWLARTVGSAGPRAEWMSTVRVWIRRGKRPMVWVPLLFLALSVASALLAPANRVAALKFATRVTTGILTFWMVADAVRSPALARALVGALVAGAGASAVLALGETFQWEPVVVLLPWFKEGPARVGGALRVGGSFHYATMAAMYFEVAVVVAVAAAATARAAVVRWMALAVAGVGSVIVVLTFTRAGMVSLALVLGLVLTAAWTRPPLRRMLPAAAVAFGALLATTAAFAFGAETFRTRLVTENDLGWYGASYTAPDSLGLAGGEASEVTVGVHNTGVARWHTTGPHPFALGYYWLLDDEPVGGGHVEVPLQGPVEPGDSARVRVRLVPQLPPGEYELVWGMLQHRILWFRHRGVPEVRTPVRVEEGVEPLDVPLVVADTLPGGATPSLPPTVQRLDLWRAAALMWVDRPLLGVGPDNFRHLYGEYLGMSRWDDRMHSNNLYLELLAGWGLAGALAFAGVVLVVIVRWLHLWRTARGSEAVLAVGLGGGFLVFFVHGLLDYFLSFTTHYLLFWMIAGLIVAMSWYSETSRSTQPSSA